jgi:DNA-binding transcriptional MerR regulator
MPRRMIDERTSSEVAELVGVDVRTLQRWRERGFISPRVTPSGQFWWTLKHCREASLLASLRQAGVSSQHLRRAVATLAGKGHNPTSTGRFLVRMKPNGKRKRLAETLKLIDQGAAIDLLKRGQVLAVFPIWSDAGERIALVDAIACEPSKGLKVGASSKHAADLDARSGVTKGRHLRACVDKP